MTLSIYVGALGVLAAAVGGIAGCVSDANPDGDRAALDADALSAAESYVASVTANGTGCAGSRWTAKLDATARTLTVTRATPPVVDAGAPDTGAADAGPADDAGSDEDAGSGDAGVASSKSGTEERVADNVPLMESRVEPGEGVDVEDCTFSIDLRAPGMSFAVESFAFQGDALLDEGGMSAAATAKFYIQGNPVGAREEREDMRGPYDNSFVLSDHIGVADLAWSPCGAPRRLNAQTRVVLDNNASRSGSGDVDVTPTFTLGLTWRKC
jgi:hypothetical protein